jgi:hypothetical protein
MWHRRSVLLATAAVLAGAFGARHAFAAPVTPDKSCDAFLEASKAARAYSDVASANLKQFDLPSGAPKALTKFDTSRMANALRGVGSGETVHYVLYAAGANRKLNPVSLQMLWSVHTNIVFVNAAADLKSPSTQWSGLKERCQSILVDSQLLAEVFAHAASVCVGGLGAEVLQLLQSKEPISLSDHPDNPARAALLLLSQKHRTNVRLVVGKLQSAFPDSKIITEHIGAFTPVDLPLWTNVKDHEGARVINDVWFPREFAEPLMKSLADEQAKAMNRH